MNRSFVTISRKWNNPYIETKLTLEGIEISINLEDFIEAVYSELNIVEPLNEQIGSVAWVFSDYTFKEKLDAAFNTIFKTQLDSAVNQVISGIKQETAKVI